MVLQMFLTSKAFENLRCCHQENTLKKETYASSMKFVPDNFFFPARMPPQISLSTGNEQIRKCRYQILNRA